MKGQPVSTGGHTHPLDELFDLIALWCVIWVTAIAVVYSATIVIESFVALSRTVKIGSYIFLVPAFVGLLMFALARNDKTGARFLEAQVKRKRILLALVGGTVIGYHISTMHERSSDLGESKRAAYWACARLPDCIRKAQEYGALEGLAVVFSAKDTR